MATTYLVVAVILFIVIISAVRFTARKKKTIVPSRDNRRTAFRLSLWEHECTLTAPSFPGKVFYGTIRDISISGVRLISYEDLTGVEDLRVHFELEEYFSLPGKIERRKKMDNGLYDFGIRFVRLDEKTEQKLFKILWDKSREKVVL
ncbi:PilZ domain-containing protein [Neobacillus cucumis]|uniref:PilZ domain-containing protein n=1 Tax=Neobacillus cucumis TaxID=1740721 RepID=UPI0015E0748A|nr:PilZ domain-containing protein [Neobacillus cucumis]